MTNAIAGVLPILHTPFTAKDQIDQGSFRQQIDWVFATGADGVCLAMVSELLRLTTDERIELTRAMADLLEEYGPEKSLFKPESAPIGPNLSALRDRTGGQARVFEGSGGILLVDSFRRGVVGTMLGVDLLDGIVALKTGDNDLVYRLDFSICVIVALQLQAGLDGFLAIEKHILVKRELFSSTRRRAPYAWSLDGETQAEVDRLLEHLMKALR